MNKYYVVWKGRKTGIFSTWTECRQQVDGFSSARYKSFPSKAKAEVAFKKTTKIKTQSNRNKAADEKNKKQPRETELTQANIDSHRYDYKIFCDGASRPNPGESASGIAIFENNNLIELQFGLYNSHGTNNTAELRALHCSLEQAKLFLKKEKCVAIYSDSTYAINAIKNWGGRWKNKGWKTKGEDVNNKEIIFPMYELYLSLRKHYRHIDLFHVKKHARIIGNELADRMTIHGIEMQEPELGIFQDLDTEAVLCMDRG